MSDSVPPGWKLVKLGDVATETSERVDNPSKSGYDRFVGLEHLDSGELTVRRWGSTIDLLSAMKLFKNGDILIGRRNAYLKRASKVEFDGVCSGDAYVVREKPGTIASGLLSIILNTNSFWDYTIAHASGTMSKRAKWRDLADYNFMLPSIDDQHRIATIIWAAEDCIVKGERFLAAAERAKQVLMRELFSKGIGHNSYKEDIQLRLVPDSWEIKSVGECCISSAYGPRFSCELYDDTGNVALLRTTDMDIDGNISYSTMPKSKLPLEKFQDHFLLKDDLIISRSGTCGIVGIFSGFNIPVLPGAFLIRFRLKDILNVKFLKYYLNTKEGKKRLSQLESGGVQKNLRGSDLLEYKIPFPPFVEQLKIADILTRCDETIAATQANITATKTLKMRLINELLSPPELCG